MLDDDRLILLRSPVKPFRLLLVDNCVSVVRSLPPASHGAGILMGGRMARAGSLGGSGAVAGGSVGDTAHR